MRNEVVLVTGGNRGLGRAFVEEALARGARKVYAAARDPRSVSIPGAVPLALDVTDPDSVRRAAAEAPDVTVLINNAGITTRASMLHGDLDDIRREFETNFYGTINVTRAFAPVLAANGGGHVLDVHSVLSWISQGTSYSASKAAVWQATNAFRLELAPQGTTVTGLHVGYIDTEMTAGVDAPKVTAQDVARQALDGVAAGDFEVLADEVTRTVKRGLSADPAALYPQLV
ncbi:SDR family oxidoreductase [Dactylosporangium sp. NPDC000244]|uniref:SDR family oxidoreductase n=1 Tax=Dactylosporangium sp. NPDC000244 TaxID=3154365 RepID=UPI003321B48E|nr:SDR family oxidoreductase [Dactylosporangium thailandense]